MSTVAIHPLVQAALTRYHIDAKAIACDPDLADTAAFCEHYGYGPEESANTIIVASRTEPTTFVACLVLANTRLDVNKKVRQLVGIRKLSFATPEQTKALTDMLIGGVTVIGLPENLPLYIDAAVMAQPRIIIGGGNRSSKLILKPGELLKLSKAEVIPDLGLAR
jgi:prolyl-tRNA editing enzyme YbaK/EbsC (Cys-tRNA(Pro) deacylase)